MQKTDKILTMSQASSQSGFSLPELLLVTAILGYVLSVVLLSFINSSALNEANRNLVTATSHAEYILENIKNTATANVSADITAGNWTWNTAAVTSNGLTALNSESITSTVSGTTLLDVTVTVAWQDKGGRARSKTLRTLIST